MEIRKMIALRKEIPTGGFANQLTKMLVLLSITSITSNVGIASVSVLEELDSSTVPIRHLITSFLVSMLHLLFPLEQ